MFHNMTCSKHMRSLCVKTSRICIYYVCCRVVISLILEAGSIFLLRKAVVPYYGTLTNGRSVFVFVVRQDSKACVGLRFDFNTKYVGS